MTTMAQDRSPEYIRNWLSNIARQTGLANHEIAPIVERVTGQTGICGTPPHPLIDEDRAAQVVGAMTPEQAQAVITKARALCQQRYPHGRCHYCGLPLNCHGECDECV